MDMFGPLCNLSKVTITAYTVHEGKAQCTRDVGTQDCTSPQYPPDGRLVALSVIELLSPSPQPGNFLSYHTGSFITRLYYAIYGLYFIMTQDIKMNTLSVKDLAFQDKTLWRQ
jgi:hypothetical protein